MRFDETWQLILRDKKTQTTRPVHFFEWYRDYPRTGKKVQVEAQDPFCPKNLSIRITNVLKARLGDVASKEEHYVREGFATGEEFITTWKKIHGSYDPSSEVCIIRFVKVD